MLATATFVVLLSLVAGQERLLFYCGFETDTCSLDTALQPLTNANAWQRTNKKTPSQNTGPSFAYNGTFFLFFLSSLPNNINSSNLPLTLTLSSSATSLRLKFALHAYGSDIQSFNIRFFNANMGLLRDDQVLSGQLQASSDAPWTVVDKTYTFTSTVMTIQFVVGCTPYKFQANVAIDDLSVYGSGSCGTCGANAQCVTNNNIQQCVCLSGFTGDGYTCTPTVCTSCSANAQCLNVNGAFQCVCNNGYIGNGNICTLGCGVVGRTCGTNAQCVSVNGVQQCTCLNGYSGDGITCTPSVPSVCNNCNANAQCLTVNGVQQCVCNNGYIGNGITCTFDICSTCSANAQCLTVNGAQQCVCNNGFTGNGNTCSLGCGVVGRTCGTNAQCVSVNGVQQCTCLNGYTGDGITCSPSSNLCGSVVCSPYADCVTEFNLPVCRCRQGYVCGDKCVTNGLCSNFATCSVVNGLEKCTCAPEYSGDGLSAPGSTGCKSKCELAACPMYSSCTLNSAYVASCQCNPNFFSNNGVCADVNECLTSGWCRGANTYCLNSIGGYSCECQPNYLVNASTSGRDRSCPTFQTCSIGKTCNCTNLINPTSVPSITFFYGVNDANPATALQFLNIWSDANVKAYCKATGCDQGMLGDIVANITIYVKRADEMMSNSMNAMQQVRDYINCNSYEALEPAWWNLYDVLSSQYIVFKQVRRDLDMKLTFMMDESKRCETTNADWFRKYLEWLSPVKF
ncbi:neurogenic locus notch homolog protein 1 isoform X2 [Hydra vulgaris]|uniref:neurogenic locus notch homolog protein 1 isoform X2 n=1 Tax=Hydra vulgaris TaxID=6087 RepID=UPI000640E37F|nr:neurogenic locus notch homolog protein 1 isoform X2 [Hydra vulgaris]